MPIISKELQIKAETDNIKILANIESAETAFALYHNVETLGIEFPTYSDGRGFTLAKRLRNLGFAGRLRAIGPVIPDQFAELVDVGFDEVEITNEQLNRQPPEQWFAALKAYTKTYQQVGQKPSIIAARWGKR